MSQILLLKDKEGASADELFQILSRYALSRNSVCSIRHIKNLVWEEVVNADILICVRGDTPFMWHILSKAKKGKKFIVYFLDDALKDIPDDTFRYPKRKEWHLECVKLCNVLLTTNPLIADGYKQYIKQNRTALIHTAVNSLKEPHGGSERNNIRIVYAASEWHLSNYNLIIKPIIDKLLNDNLGKVELYFVGFNPHIEGHDNDVHVVPKMSLNEYQNYMLEMDFDIGLAPLVDSYFSERKYFNKFIEYTRNGICGLYSDVYPYKFVVKNLENGFLVDNDPSTWLRAIQDAICCREKCLQCIKNAQEYLKNNHSDDVIFFRLEKDIPEIRQCYDIKKMQTKQSLFSRKMLLYYPFYIKEKMYMVLYSLKSEGIKLTLKRIMKR